MVGLQEVEVYKDDLLERLRKNRETHRETFLKALEGYKRALEKAFQERIAQLTQGRIPSQNIRLPEPEDHIRDYDRIITMVEMSVEDTVRLTQQEFAHYALDDWGWKDSFTMTTSRYT